MPLVFFFCFVALRLKSTAMVIAGRSVHLTTLFPGQAWTSGKPVIRAQTFACNWQKPFLNASAEGRRMTVEIISWSISTKVWDRAGIELATPGIAVRHASVARHVTDCATRPSAIGLWFVIVAFPRHTLLLFFFYINDETGCLEWLEIRYWYRCVHNDKIITFLRQKWDFKVFVIW